MWLPQGPGTPWSFDDSLVDDVFFDVATPTSPFVKDIAYAPPFEKSMPAADVAPIMQKSKAEMVPETGTSRWVQEEFVLLPYMVI